MLAQRSEDLSRLRLAQPRGVGRCAEQFALGAAAHEQRHVEKAVVRARDVEEREAVTGDPPIVVRTLDIRGEVLYSRGDMLDALAQLLEVPMHVADRRERVVGGQVDLAAVGEGDQWVGRLYGGRVAHHRGFNLRLARRHDASIEVHLGA